MHEESKCPYCGRTLKFIERNHLPHDITHWKYQSVWKCRGRKCGKLFATETIFAYSSVDLIIHQGLYLQEKKIADRKLVVLSINNPLAYLVHELFYGDRSKGLCANGQAKTLFVERNIQLYSPYRRTLVVFERPNGYEPDYKHDLKAKNYSSKKTYTEDEIERVVEVMSCVEPDPEKWKWHRFLIGKTIHAKAQNS